MVDAKTAHPTQDHQLMEDHVAQTYANKTKSAFSTAAARNVNMGMSLQPMGKHALRKKVNAHQIRLRYLDTVLIAHLIQDLQLIIFTVLKNPSEQLEVVAALIDR